MGSGKSTVGKLLAEQLKLNFIDFDRYIEQGEGRTIAEIFDSEGEERFRTLEHEYLKKLLPEQNVIISLGGGTPCFHNSIELINNNGISVYLEMDAETLAARLVKAKNKRPLIRDLNETELKYFIETNLEKRQATYNQAHFTVISLQQSVEELAKKIVKIITA